jgi:glucan endo-1,6-beta-glucosidase
LTISTLYTIHVYTVVRFSIMHFSTLLLSTFALTSWAWLPSERDLFRVSTQDASETSLPAGKGRTVKRFLPSSGKIRGVNLGSLFIVEPWMAPNEWSKIGCGSSKSEFDCVLKLGQAAADSAFQAHWARWITEQDIISIASLGLNTIRIPVGYWILESLVSSSEHFPRGGINYLETVCGWAAAHGLYVIIDLHGAPMAQVAQQPFTGQVSLNSFQSFSYGLVHIITLVYLLNSAIVSLVRIDSSLLPNIPIRPRDQIPDLDNPNHPHKHRLPHGRHHRSP